MENSIKITGLTKRFGSKVALDSIDLDIPQGMFGLRHPRGKEQENTKYHRLSATGLFYVRQYDCL